MWDGQKGGPTKGIGNGNNTGRKALSRLETRDSQVDLMMELGTICLKATGLSM